MDHNAIINIQQPINHNLNERTSEHRQTWKISVRLAAASWSIKSFFKTDPLVDKDTNIISIINRFSKQATYVPFYGNL